MALIKIARVRFATDESMAMVTRDTSSAFRGALEDLLAQVAAGVIANDPTIIAAAEAAVAQALEDSGLVRFVDPAIPNDTTASDTYSFAVLDQLHRVSDLALDLDGRLHQNTINRIAQRLGVFDGVSGVPGWDIVIAAGQSNSGDPDAPVPGIYSNDPRVLQWANGNTDDLDPTVTAIGPEFAREYIHTPQAPPRTVVVARVGSGGTGFTTSSISPAPSGYKSGSGTWDRTLISDPNNYVEMLLNTANAMLSAGGAGSRIVAILWSQGEVETNGEPTLTKTEYAVALDDLIGHVRSELGDTDIPWIIGSTNPNWYTQQADRRAICEALAETPIRMTRTAYVWGPEGMTDRDTSEIHWSAAGQMYRAREMARNGLIAALMNQSGTEPAAVQNLRSRRSGNQLTIEWDRPLSHVSSISVETSTDGTTWTAATLDAAHGARASATASGAVTVRVSVTNGKGTARVSIEG